MILLLTSVPIWVFNVLSALIYMLLVPVGAAAMTYVYATLATEKESAGRPRVVPEPAP